MVANAEPSLTLMNEMPALELRRVRTQPRTVTVPPGSTAPERRSLMVGGSMVRSCRGAFFDKDARRDSRAGRPPAGADMISDPAGARTPRAPPAAVRG